MKLRYEKRMVNAMSNKTKIAVTMATVISLGGIAWTQSREGTVLKPYYDSVKVATIGRHYGLSKRQNSQNHRSTNYQETSR